MAPVHERPAAPIPASWAQPVSANALTASPPLDWETFVTDESLRQTIALALTHNRDLRQTLLNIDVARAQYRVQRADRLAGLGLQADGTRQRTPADISAAGVAGTQGTYQVGLGMTAFELDLFGRVRSLSDAALQQYLAVEHSAQAARISLVGEVIQAHVTRDGAQRRLAWTQKTLDSRQASLQLVAQRRQAGAASALDYQEALGLQAQAQAELERMEREARQADNALRLLVGSADAAWPAPRAQSTVLVQDIAVAAPSALLERRPDILAAEHELRARNADIGAARAAFFPRISLTGMFGSSSAELSGLFESGSRSWSFTPQLVLPLFDGGRNRANLDLAQVRKNIAVARYEGTIQTAFREVSDALAATDTLRREEVSRLALARSSDEALRLSEARYRGGVDSHLRYLEAQRSAFSHQLSAIEVGTQRQLALVQLFKALGGGWS
ncbi:MAG: efflux transporter outer membrane subunit, partial [Comamonas sp.]